MKAKIKPQTRMQALQAGMWVEREHKHTYAWLKERVNKGVFPSENEFYQKVAEDHLREDMNYYAYLLVMESMMTFFKKTSTGEFTVEK